MSFFIWNKRIEYTDHATRETGRKDFKGMNNNLCDKLTQTSSKASTTQTSESGVFWAFVAPGERRLSGDRFFSVS